MEARDRLFAEIAQRLQLLSPEQLRQCDEHVRAHAGVRLGDAALALGLLSADELELVRVQELRVEERRRTSRATGEQPEPRAVPEARPSRRVRAWAPSREPSGGGAVRVPLAKDAAPAAAPAARARRQDQETQPLTSFEREAQHESTQPEPRPRRAPPAAIPAQPAARSASADPEVGFGVSAEDRVVSLSDLPPAPAPAQASPLPDGTHEGVKADVAAPLPGGAFQRGPFTEPPRTAAPAPDAPPRRTSLVPPAPAPNRPAPYAPSAHGFVGKALQQAAAHGASDLHVHTGMPLGMRMDGRLLSLAGKEPLPSEQAERVLAELLDDEQWAALALRGQVDLALSLPGIGRVRANVYRQQRGLSAVFRIIAERPPTLEQLGLPGRLARLTDFRTGLVLCTGPAGSGKSSTLAALLASLIETRPAHVITIEDPVELVLPQGKALVNQRQLHDHTQSFARALRAALREAPDVIAITDLRDRETIGLALSAAETGHLVLGTLQTSSVTQTVHRIVGAFAPDEREQMRVLLAESLRAVVSQRLLPRAKGPGRVAALELLMVNTAAGALIRDDKVHQLPSAMQTGKAAGMLTLDDSLHELLQSAQITAETARRFAVKKERFA